MYRKDFIECIKLLSHGNYFPPAIGNDTYPDSDAQTMRIETQMCIINNKILFENVKTYNNKEKHHYDKKRKYTSPARILSSLSEENQ